MRLIVVRGFPGHDRDDALVCTDPSMSPAQIVEGYVQSGHKLRATRPAAMPWYSSKVTPAFSDMLATLRRASWAARLFDPHGKDSTFKKRVEPLLACLDAAA